MEKRELIAWILCSLLFLVSCVVFIQKEKLDTEYRQLKTESIDLQTYAKDRSVSLALISFLYRPSEMSDKTNMMKVIQLCAKNMSSKFQDMTYCDIFKQESVNYFSRKDIIDMNWRLSAYSPDDSVILQLHGEGNDLNPELAAEYVQPLPVDLSGQTLHLKLCIYKEC